MYCSRRARAKVNISLPNEISAFEWKPEVTLAERVGFEPTWGLRPQRISSPRRYGHFGTSPNSVQRGGRTHIIECRVFVLFQKLRTAKKVGYPGTTKIPQKQTFSTVNEVIRYEKCGNRTNYRPIILYKRP